MKCVCPPPPQLLWGNITRNVVAIVERPACHFLYSILHDFKLLVLQSKVFVEHELALDK